MKEYQTEQRKQLIAFLEQHCDEQLPISTIAAALPEQTDISRSAVYRNVDRLVKEGLLRRTADEGGRTFLYQYIGSALCREHVHIQCTGCGQIFHLNSETEKIIQDAVQKGSSFAFDGQKTVLFGRCAQCDKSEQKQ